MSKLADMLADKAAERDRFARASDDVQMPPIPTAAVDPVEDPREDAMTMLRRRITQQLFTSLSADLGDDSVTEKELTEKVQATASQIVREIVDVPLSATDRGKLITAVVNDALRLGPIQPLLEDKSVSEVMVNGPDQVYVERNGKLVLTDVKFESNDALVRVINRIVSQIGRRVDESSPMVDARLADGSRVNATVPPISLTGATLTIRKFPERTLDVNDLINLGTLDEQIHRLLRDCVLGKLNIIVSGGTGTGKTTLLNMMSSFIPENERVITIEDAAELRMVQPHVVRMESRPPNVEGKGEITIRDLVRNALRMRPDRIVVGEVRGPETLDMLQAMNTGHDGSLSTVHANDPRGAISRLETMTMSAGGEMPLQAIREQIASSVDLIVQIARLRDGTRRITSITEVVGMEGATVTAQEVFKWATDGKTDRNGRFIGAAVATGVRPQFSEKLKLSGIEIPPGVFTAPSGQGV